jgi:hypothetical protein
VPIRSVRPSSSPWVDFGGWNNELMSFPTVLREYEDCLYCHTESNLRCYRCPDVYNTSFNLNLEIAMWQQFRRGSTVCAGISLDGIVFAFVFTCEVALHRCILIKKTSFVGDHEHSTVPAAIPHMTGTNPERDDQSFYNCSRFPQWDQIVN